ncbi:hypothetical protein I316_07450 [Kwoniella heveanensis BCC8398]|uniref:Uncharacterized protein n=1 Tax=Kwoniella heveanensis BCC8398 TaxID=1296120 RepID=A0A1B9GIL4_9TREE|nr:hypothetical protein I316_07450 [Kwoniella heveanensis BCC8398]
MSPPINITFHFPTSSALASAPGSSSQFKSKRLIATNSRIGASAQPIIISYDKPRKQHKSSHHNLNKTKPPTLALAAPATNTVPSPPETDASTSCSSDTPSTISTGSKRRKGPVFCFPSSEVKMASLTPLLRPIVTRCAIPTTADDHGSSSFSHPSPPRKRNSGLSKSARVTPSLTSPLIHPYSRASDLSNTRSSVPSPREILRAQKAEEEKARLKKESAAAARAATAAKRKKAQAEKAAKTRSGSKAPAIGGRRGRSDSPSNVSNSKTSSPEQVSTDKLPTITTQPASSTESSPAPSTLGARPSGLKRTRSQGVLPISTSLASASTGNGVVVGSPLKAVMSRDEDDDAPRKRSKLASEEIASGSATARRANSHSPVGTPTALPEDDTERLSKTFPLPAGSVLPSRLIGRASSTAPYYNSVSVDLGGSAMRRAVSATAYNEGRAGSVGSDGSGRERSKRETQLPERLRDYDVKAGAAI